ncbi:hypothetical protein D3C86_1904360 [compost metagenome]
MAKQHPLVGGDIVQPVVATFGRGHAAVVELKDFFGDKQTVEAISDAVTGDRRYHQPNRIDVFTAA